MRSITAQGDKNTNYVRTQCVFQGVSSIANASIRTEEEKERKKAGKRVRYCRKRNRCRYNAFYCVGVYVGCVGRGGPASAGAWTTQSACERKGHASGKSGINIITFLARDARGENSWVFKKILCSRWSARVLKKENDMYIKYEDHSWN